MEIDSTSGAFVLNNILNNATNNRTNKYGLLFNSVKVKDKTKFIASVYSRETLVLRFEYDILGTYHKTKNVWLWADQSVTVNKSIVKHVEDLRDNYRLRKLKHISFITQNYSVLPTLDLLQNMSDIGKVLLDVDKRSQIVTFLRNDDFVDFYIVKDIIFESLL